MVLKLKFGVNQYCAMKIEVQILLLREILWAEHENYRIDMFAVRFVLFPKIALLHLLFVIVLRRSCVIVLR